MFRKAKLFKDTHTVHCVSKSSSTVTVSVNTLPTVSVILSSVVSGTTSCWVGSSVLTTAAVTAATITEQSCSTCLRSSESCVKSLPQPMHVNRSLTWVLMCAFRLASWLNVRPHMLQRWQFAADDCCPYTPHDNIHLLSIRTFRPLDVSPRAACHIR